MTKPIVIAITGGRDYTPTETQLEEFVVMVSNVDNDLAATFNIVHGAARGVDTTVAQWCFRFTRFLITTPCPIDTTLDGTDRRYMGFNRNERMLSTYKPVALVAFPGGYGTEDCIRRAKRKGIKVYYVGRV